MFKNNIEYERIKMEDVNVNKDENVVSLEEKMSEFEEEKPKINKVQEVKELIENSEKRVAETDSSVRECKIMVSKTASRFDDLKRTFHHTIFKNTEELLEKVGADALVSQGDTEFELSLNQADQNYFNIQNIYTGRATGFILAFLAFLVTVALWLYFASKSLNIDPKTITFSNVEEQVNPVLNWIGGGIIHQKGTAEIGALILGFSALIVGWIVYAIRVSMKANKNLRIAKKTYNATAQYTYTQEECQTEMKAIEAHLDGVNRQIQNFNVLLDEKNAVLKRIIYVEGVNDDAQAYHHNSKIIIRDTERLVNTIERVLNTSITKEGKLNPQSVQALSTAEAVYEDAIAKEYA